MFLILSRRMLFFIAVLGSVAFVSLFVTTPAWTAGTTGTASARIIKPLAIETVPGFDTLRFGTIVPDTTQTGTVTLTPVGTTYPTNITRTVQNVTTLGNDYGIAMFSVTGEAGESVKVDYDTISTLTRDGGGGQMPVHISSSIPNSPFPLPAAGSALFVGGTLEVAANQPPGSYSGQVNVTVSY